MGTGAFRAGVTSLLLPILTGMTPKMHVDVMGPNWHPFGTLRKIPLFSHGQRKSVSTKNNFNTSDRVRHVTVKVDLMSLKRLRFDSRHINRY